jgi:hypothetical protein
LDVAFRLMNGAHRVIVRATGDWHLNILQNSDVTFKMRSKASEGDEDRGGDFPGAR